VSLLVFFCTIQHRYHGREQQMGSQFDPLRPQGQDTPGFHSPQQMAGSPSQVSAALPVSLPASQTLQRLALAEVQARARQCLDLLGSAPTADQWKMILSPTTSTCVIAGAGSGKSTTLILRLLILHKLLGIALDEMHVFSFTKASTEDFQNKLASQLARWEERMERRQVTEQRREELQKAARRVVSTFHSVIARLRPAVIMGDFPGFFDLLGDTPPGEDEVTNFNPFLLAKLSAQQREVLGAAHTAAYYRSPEYRSVVNALLAEEDRQQWMRGTTGQDLRAESEPAIWQAFLRQESTYHGFDRYGTFAPAPGFQDRVHSWHVDPYRAAVADRLRELGVSFLPLPSFSIRNPIRYGQDGQMRAAFQIGALFLHIERYTTTKQSDQAKRRLAYHERDRRKLIATYADHADHHKVLTPRHFAMQDGRLVLSPDGDLQLLGWLASQGQASAQSAAPVVRVKVPGDINRRLLAELLYQEGVFIESLGLEVEQVQIQGSLDQTSRAVAQALPIFWRFFQAELQSRRLLRFHHVLTVLRQETTLRALRGQVRHLKHLFIDEFQDVSPEIVDWLAKTLGVHVRDGGEEVSVTCIGDDYQSIYGWRGSHPIFLMDFPRFFKSTRHGQVVLAENFRSRQPIIDAAEAILHDVGHKITKHGRSMLPEPGPGKRNAVSLQEARLSWRTQHATSNIWHTFSQYVGAVLGSLATSGSLEAYFRNRSDLSVFILARTNAVTAHIPYHRLGDQLAQFLRELGLHRFRHVRVRIGTFHRSKGLEADFVLLLEDSLPPEQHPLREMIFGQAPFLGRQAGTYLQNVTDEARRLAYVALTRARFGVMWVPLVESAQSADENGEGAPGANAQSDASISTQGFFALVKRYVQTQA
jgi:hypothetical protein